MKNRTDMDKLHNVTKRHRDIFISLKMASKWLENGLLEIKNGEGKVVKRFQRPLNYDYVTGLVAQIVAGSWIGLTHQGIALFKDRFDRTLVLDGQHRLLAIVTAKIPVQMPVTTYESQASTIKEANDQYTLLFSIIDSMNKRTVAHTISLDGIDNYQEVAATCNIIVLMLNGGRWRGRLSVKAREKIREVYPWMDDYISKCPPTHGINLAAVYGGLTFARFSDHRVDQFRDALYSGAELPKGHPAWALRTYLLSEHVAVKSKNHQYQTLQTVMCALHHFLKEEALYATARPSIEAVKWFMASQAANARSILPLLGLGANAVTAAAVREAHSSLSDS